MAELGTEAGEVLGLGSGIGVPGLGKDPFFASGVKRLGELGSERKKAQAAFDKDTAGLQTKIGEERKAAADLPAPKLENVGEKFQHQGMNGEQWQEAMQTMFAFAAIGGAMTRAPMTAALHNLAAGLKGLHQGDQILFKREAQEFDRNLKVAMAKNQQAMNEYKLAYDKHRGNMQDLMNEWNIIAKKHGDTVSAINMERQDIQGMLRQIESMKKIDMQADRTQKMFSAQMARIEAQERARDADRESREREREWDRQSREGIAAMRDQTARAKIEAARTKGGELNLKGKQLDSYIHNTANIAAIEDIIKELETNPDAVGFKTLVPGIILNRADPEGTPVRASIANLTSMTIKDRAGTAQTASEMKNIAPFIPRDGDDNATVATKLRGMQREMKRMNDTAVAVTSGAAGAGGQVGPYDDAEKEARYQAWKAKQGK